MIATIVFAVLSALSNACSAVLQRLAVVNRTSGARPGWRAMVELVRQPVWLLGALFLAGTFGFQALALYFGPLSVVQPLLVLELIFTLGLRVFLLHDGIAPQTWSAALTICLGLAAFLVVASPHRAPMSRAPGSGCWRSAPGPWSCWRCSCSAVTARPPVAPPWPGRPRPSCGPWTPRS